MRGEKGDPGPVSTLNILGTLTNSGELPSAATSKPGEAFLVGQPDAYDFYVLVGTAPENYNWVDMGVAGGGTIITVGGSAVGTFNADTKVNTTAQPSQVYHTDAQGNQVYSGYANSPIVNNFVRWSGDKTIRTEAPVSAKDCINKQYLETQLNNYIPVGNLPTGQLKGVMYDPATGKFGYRSVATYVGATSNGNLCQYFPKDFPTANTEGAGSLVTCMPTYKYQCAPKEYVDLQHRYCHQITLYNSVEDFIVFNITNSNSQEYTDLSEIPYGSYITQGFITMDGQSGLVPVRLSRDADLFTLEYSDGESGILTTSGISSDFPYSLTDTVLTLN